MRLQGESKFTANREMVWQVLNSPESLKNCTPGCKELIQIDEDTYETKMEIGVAAIKGVYHGKTIDLFPPTSTACYLLHIAGFRRSLWPSI